MALGNIDIQFLDGVDDRRQSPTIADVVNFSVGNYNEEVADEMTVLSQGGDFLHFKGDGSDSDDTMLLSYLVRTKGIVDHYPEAIACYQNPKQFSNMLQFVIDNWDTANREAAVTNMAREEKRLVKNGGIVVNPIENGNSDKRFAGFFASLNEYVQNPALGKFGRSLHSGNQLLQGVRNTMRQLSARQRTIADAGLVTSDGKSVRFKIYRSGMSAPLNGPSETVNAVMSGSALCGVDEADGDASYQSLVNYVLGVRELIVANPVDICGSEETAAKVLKQFDYALQYAEDSDTFIAAVGYLSALTEQPGVLGSLKGFWKGVCKCAKNVVKAVGKACKAVATGVANAAKWVANGFKKVIKFIIKYNPICLLIRAGIMIVVKLNMFRLAQKTYGGLISESEAKSKFGLTSEKYQKAVKAYKVLKNVFTAIGGDEDKLKKWIAQGMSRKWSGSDEFSKAALEKAAAENIDEMQNAVDSDEAALTAAGAETTSDPNVMYEQTEVTTEVPENLMELKLLKKFNNSCTAAGADMMTYTQWCSVGRPISYENYLATMEAIKKTVAALRKMFVNFGNKFGKNKNGSSTSDTNTTVKVISSPASLVSTTTPASAPASTEADAALPFNAGVSASSSAFNSGDNQIIVTPKTQSGLLAFNASLKGVRGFAACNAANALMCNSGKSLGEAITAGVTVTAATPTIIEVITKISDIGASAITVIDKVHDLTTNTKDAIDDVKDTVETGKDIYKTVTQSGSSQSKSSATAQQPTTSAARQTAAKTTQANIQANTAAIQTGQAGSSTLFYALGAVVLGAGVIAAVKSRKTM